ncbi:uncharacterized protein LOC119555854 [Drosophila subpulchrella]|uniref:uncharacterized protein LOC119555854 n=1 Tax=Drosophila subpulchrella TaxID=1486046 RepID=UPI0018A17A04|nr:uncharacterized protein LOC119555854 [Drosophila subpulchrella]
MRKLVSFILCGLVVLYVLVSPADSKDMGESVCLLQNAPVQCSHFCLAALRPITDGIRGTQDKLDRLESKLLAVENLLSSHTRPITDGIRGTQDKLDRLESKLLAVENLLSSHTIPLEVFEKRLTLVEGQLQESRTLQDAHPDTLTKIYSKIPPVFERIGSRVFAGIFNWG